LFYFADDQEISSLKSQPSYKEGTGVDVHSVINYFFLFPPGVNDNQA
jgi:hypothetical protein